MFIILRISDMPQGSFVEFRVKVVTWLAEGSFILYLITWQAGQSSLTFTCTENIYQEKCSENKTIELSGFPFSCGLCRFV